MKTLLLLLTVLAAVTAHRLHRGSPGFARSHGGVLRPGGGPTSGLKPDSDRIIFPDSRLPVSPSVRPLRPQVRPLRPQVRPLRPQVRPLREVRPLRPDIAVRPLRPQDVVRPAHGPIWSDVVISNQQCKPYITSQVHYESDSGEYHFSWCSDKGGKYNWEDANTYCKQLGRGWGGLSIESEVENNEVVDIIEKHQLPYIWTSGNRYRDPYTTNVYNWRWDSTGQRVSFYDWSKTGEVPGRSQPDDHENGSEQCLSLLNRSYPKDGITWHDVACHHLKPIICERQSSKIYYR